MSEEVSRKFRKELNSGAVSLVLLSLLRRHAEPMYGYEIARVLEANGDDELPMNQAAIYPVLRSLEKQNLLSSQMVPSDSGPPRRYYRLTAAGKQAQMKWREVWVRTRRFVDSMLAEVENELDQRTHSQASGRARNRS